MATTSLPKTLRRYGLPAAAIGAIQQVLVGHPQVQQGVLYGSLAIGSHRPASDIDLSLIGTAISSRIPAQIDAELDDLLQPWIIDLPRHSDLSHPPLLDHIERAGQVFYRKADPSG